MSTATEKWDAKLNKAYKELLDLLTNEQKEKLKIAQREWIEYRDKEILFSNQLYYDMQGTMWISVAAHTKLDLTRKRTIELEIYISNFDYRQVMEQEPTPIIELLVLILFSGSITFLLGAIFQGYVLYKNKKSLLISILVIILTRILTMISSIFIWAFWQIQIDIMFLFFFLPAILPELIFKQTLNHFIHNRY